MKNTQEAQIAALTSQFEQIHAQQLWNQKKFNFEKGRILSELKPLLLEERGAWERWLKEHELARQTAEDLIRRFLTEPLPDDPGFGTETVASVEPILIELDTKQLEEARKRLRENKETRDRKVMVVIPAVNYKRFAPKLERIRKALGTKNDSETIIRIVMDWAVSNG